MIPVVHKKFADDILCGADATDPKIKHDDHDPIQVTCGECIAVMSERGSLRLFI